MNKNLHELKKNSQLQKVSKNKIAPCNFDSMFLLLICVCVLNYAVSNLSTDRTFCCVFNNFVCLFVCHFTFF